MPDNPKEIKKLIKIMKKGLIENPYNKKKQQIEYNMWNEQCKINFPILYLSSIYLYEYGRQRECNNYLFATRDCCQWYKIFKQLYPKVQSTYFHCSRNMFERATENPNEAYKSYVKKQVKDNISKTVFVDIHGTGKRMFSYFEKEFEKVPYCFLLSATFNNYNEFPSISKAYYKKEKIINLIFNTRGSPIEMLNYDNIGTLQNFTQEGPIRDELEYNVELIKPYHDCINYLLKLIEPQKDIDCKSKLHMIKKEIKEYFDYLKNKELVLASFIRHIGKHKKKEINDNNNKNINIIKDIKIGEYNINNNCINNSCVNNNCITDEVCFEKIISDDTVYAIVWEGKYNNLPCVIKMIKLNTGICNPQDKIFTYSNEEPYRHKDFKNKKEMSIDEFNHELNQLKHLYKYKLSPKVFKSFICNKYEVHYGFIVMEKYDCSLKQIFKKRAIKHEEEKIIYKMISKLHENKIVHRDMKPSNIGVNLNDEGKIIESCFFDCSKVKHKSTHESKKFKYLIKRDWDTYFRHKEQNMQK